MTNGYRAGDGLVTITYALDATSTNISCIPAKNREQCTATVTDSTTPGSTPTGTVSFSSSGRGTFSSSTCALSETTVGTASCSVTYAAKPPKSSTGQMITANYGGDSTHLASSDTTTLS
jgi:hypothetical protein